MLPFLFPPMTFFLQPPSGPVLEAKTLPTVPGPMAPKGPDPAAGPGSDAFMLRMRASARKGSLPALGLPPGPLEVRDGLGSVPGWKAYRLEVQPGTTVKVRLKGLHEAWFQVKAVNRWGELEAGMLQNRIPTGNPEASYINASKETKTVFFVVDTTNDSVSKESYSLFVTYP